MLISTLSYNAIPFTTVFSQFFTFLLLSSHLLHATVCIIKSFLCHDIKQAMSYHIMEFYVTTCRMSRLSRYPYYQLDVQHMAVFNMIFLQLSSITSSNIFQNPNQCPLLIGNVSSHHINFITGVGI